jgi:hypothetical protein
MILRSSSINVFQKYVFNCIDGCYKIEFSISLCTTILKKLHMVSNVKAVWLVVLKVELSRASFSSSKYVNGVKYKLFKKKKKKWYLCLGEGRSIGETQLLCKLILN